MLNLEGVALHAENLLALRFFRFGARGGGDILFAVLAAAAIAVLIWAVARSRKNAS